MTQVVGPKPYQLVWPPTAEQWSWVDDMFRRLFTSTRQIGAVAGSSAGMVIGEVPSGTIDGANTTFITALDYAGLSVYLNGQRLTKDDDYTETAARQFDLATAPSSPDVVTVDYGLTAVIGAQGPAGADGATGATGATGAAGSNGTNGTNGANGTPTLLEYRTSGGAASLDCTTRNATGVSGATFQSDFDAYLIVIDVQAASGASVGIRVSTDGGLNYSTTNYAYACNFAVAAGTGGSFGSVTDNMLAWRPGNADVSGNWPNVGSLVLHSPLASAYKQFVGSISIRASVDTAAGPTLATGVWAYKSATAVNAFQVVASSGNISGAVRVYGLANS